MKLRTKALAYGVSGLVLAGLVIFSGTSLNLMGATSSGFLSVMLTDPPTVPSGVSALYVSYSGIAVHAEGFGDGGWVALAGSGTINTLELVNLSQTITTGSIPSLTYDLVRFNITSASVLFMGKNYSVTMNAGKVTVPFVGGLKVNSSGIAAALIDIQPTILGVGTASAPEFAMATEAKALQVPSGEVNDSMKTVGHTLGLQGRGWFQSFRAAHSTDATGSGAKLSASALSFSLTNGGSDPIAIRMVVVTPASSQGGVGMGHGGMGSVAGGAIFAVQPDGSMNLLSGVPAQASSLLGDSGYTLAPGATQQFSYSGTIATMMGGGIVSGGNYYVVVMGSGTLSEMAVVAG